jgi:hypothetical protein
MISERNNVCVKSKALVPLNLIKLMELITDLNIKPEYDDNFESGEIIQ